MMYTSGLANLHHQDPSCWTCRYYREHTTGVTCGSCLLLGRSMAQGDHSFTHVWALARVCDGWKRRPKAWYIYSEGADANPFWCDPYIPRETQHRLRVRFVKHQERLQKSS